ncbi:hypothetical protein SAMN05720762_11339, partial [Fibrobacter sp. UWH4]
GGGALGIALEKFTGTEYGLEGFAWGVPVGAFNLIGALYERG